MNHKNKEGEAFKTAHVDKSTRNSTPAGQFPTDFQGRITNNRAHGHDAAIYSWDLMFRKTKEEQIARKKAISSYNQMMRAYYGDNWKSLKGKDAVFNIPISVSKKTGDYIPTN